MNKKITMPVWAILAIAAAVFLLGLQSGYGLHRPPKCPDCPQVVPQALTVRDSSVQQPTVTLTVPRAAVRPSREYRESFHRVPAVDSGRVELRAVQEPVNCWTFPVRAPDSALIIGHLCSRMLPEMPPADAAMTLEYTAPPRVKIIERTNNVFQPCPAPPTPRRFGWVVGPYVGAGVTWLGQPTVSAGFAVVWGLKLGKLTH
jgi:hypothetical protein